MYDHIAVTLRMQRVYLFIILGCSYYLLTAAGIVIYSGSGGYSSSQQCTCTLTTWEAWTTCSKSCGGGTQNRRVRNWNDNRYCSDSSSSVSECVMCREGFKYTIIGVCHWGRVFSDSGVSISGGTQSRYCNTICYNGGHLYFYSQTSGFCICPKGARGTCCEETISCGRPSSIAHGSFTGAIFTYNHQVQYKCNSKYSMTDPSSATQTCTEHGYWSGKAPECIYAAYCESSPCRNGATCLDLLGNYQCQCLTGWTGQDCEFDIQPPVVTGCPQNRTIITADMTSRQTWEVPNITDPHGLEIKIRGNYRNNSYDFPWGNFTVQYHAVKPSNGLTAECSFTISIRPYPCEKIQPPVNGIVVCNNWKTDRVNVCIFVCKSNYTLPLQFSDDDIYVCGATGSWLPPKLVTNCVTDEFFPWTNDNDGNTFSSCSTPGATKEIGEYYIETLKKSAFNSLCVDNPIYCKPDNVLIQC